MAHQNSIRFVVTGFGPFHGVASNPTTVLATKILDFLSNDDQEETSHHLATCTEALVLETSVEDVKRQVDRIHGQVTSEDQNNSEPVVTILLHLGVNDRATKFQLESCAYNTANFRVGDERGYQPQKEPINCNYELETSFETALDVEDLLSALTSTNHTAEAVTISNDPGRFVCNYTYCYSMDRFCCSKAIGGKLPPSRSERARSLFLHVPPFSEIPEDEQLKFVRNLMMAIYKQVSAQISSQ